MSGLEIKKRKVITTKQKIKNKDGETTGFYKRYSLSLPKEFVEKHELASTDKPFYLVADQVWIGVPGEDQLLKVVGVIPEIKKLIATKGPLSKELMMKMLDNFPELIKYIKEEG